MAEAQPNEPWDSIAEQQRWVASTERASSFQETYIREQPVLTSSFGIMCLAELDAGRRLVTSGCFGTRETFLQKLKMMTEQPTSPSRPVADLEAYREAQALWLRSVVAKYEAANIPVERMAAGHTVWQFRERFAAAIAHFFR